MSMDDMQEIMEDFLIEAFEMVEQLDQDLVELESNPEDLDLLNRIFRVAHTIKGSSSFLNFDILTSLTHNMEDVLNKARKGELKITPDIMDVVLVSVDLMKALLKVIQESGTDANSGIDITDVVKKLQAISQGTNQDTNSSSQESPAPQASESKAESKATTQPKQEESPAPASSDDNPLADEPDKDYAHMSAEQVEAEIDRLLKKRQEADKQKRAEKKASEQVADTDRKSVV